MHCESVLVYTLRDDVRRVNSRFSSDKMGRVPSNLLCSVVIILGMCMTVQGELEVFNGNQTLHVRSSGAGESPVCCRDEERGCKYSCDLICR